MRFPARLAPLVVAVALLGVAADAAATTVLAVDVPEMTKLSEWVVRAHVVDVKSVDMRPAGEGLYTDVTLAIDDTYHGTAVPKRYTLRMIGGVGKDGMALTIPGMPRFTAGEEVVLFLEKTTLGHVPCGLGQGVYRVQRTKAGEVFVRPSAGGLHMMKRDTTGRLVTAHGPQTTTAQTLDQLIAEIAVAAQQLRASTPATPPVVAPTAPTVAP